MRSDAFEQHIRHPRAMSTTRFGERAVDRAHTRPVRSAHPCKRTFQAYRTRLRAALAALVVSMALSGCGVFCGGAGGSGGGFAGGCAAGMRF